VINANLLHQEKIVSRDTKNRSMKALDSPVIDVVIQPADLIFSESIRRPSMKGSGTLVTNVSFQLQEKII